MTGTNQVITSSKLMQNYCISTPVSSDTQIAAVGSTGGGSKIFSIASNGHLLMIEPDSTSDTGWSQLDLNMNGDTLTLDQRLLTIVAVADAKGATHLAAVVATDDPTSRSIYYVSNFEAAPELERWIFCGRVSNTVVSNIAVGFDTNQNPLVAVVTKQTTSDGTDKYAIEIIHIQSGVKPSSWSPLFTTSPPKQILDIAVGTFKALGSGVFVSYLDENGVPRLEFNGVPAYHHIIDRGSATYNKLAVAQGADGNSMLFVATGGNMYYNDPNLGLTKIGSLPTPVDQLFAIRNQVGVVDVYAHTIDAKVYHAIQGVQDPIEILQKAAHMAVADSVDRFQNLFFVGYDHTLQWLTRDQQTGDWVTNVIELATTQQVEEFKSYSTEITLLDASQVPMPNRTLQITSSAIINVAINGQTYLIDSTTPVQCSTNTAGQVTLTSSTNKLASTVLSISGDFLPDGHSIEIQPNAYIQNTLETISSDQLLKAKKADGSPLLQGNYNSSDVATSLQEALNQTMSLGKTQPSDANSASFHTAMFARSENTDGLRYRTSPPAELGQLHHASVAEQHWEVDFTSGKPVFRNHTAESIAPQMLAIVNPTVLRATAALSHSDSGFSWGDLWETIKDGAIELGKIFVSTVVDPVTKFVKQIVARIEDFFGNVLWNGAINFLEQVFDVAEGIFQTVKVFFEDLFDWLGYLFNWGDILRTKEAIKHTVNQVFDLMEATLQHVRTNSDNYFATLEAQVQEAFNQLTQSQLGSQSLLAIQASQPQPPSYADSVSHNIVYSGFVNNLADGQLTTSTNLKAVRLEASNSVNNLIDQLSQYSQHFQGAESFQNAIDYFSQIGSQLQTNPQQALQSTLAGLLQILSGLAQLAIELVRQIINAILDAVTSLISSIQEILNAEWNIPFVKELYSFITDGGTLSALDLMSLIMAIPVTVFYKATYKQTPFPDDASVNQFKSIFTAQAIIAASGIESPTRLMSATSMAELSTDETFQSLIKPYVPVIGVFNIVGYWLYGLTIAGADIQPPSAIDKPATAVENGWSIASIIGESFVWFTSCPWLTNRERPVLGGTPTETGNAVWLYLPIGIATDIGFFAYSYLNDQSGGKKASLSGDIGVGVTCVVGVGYVVLYSILADTQRRANQPYALLTSANMLSTAPLIFKFLRLKAIANAPGPQQPFILPGLATLDVVTNIIAGALNFKILLDSLSPSNTK